MRFRSLLFLLGFVSFSFVLPASAQHAPTKKVKVKQAGVKTVTTPKVATSTTAGPVLTFERTSCMGACPSYSMQVYADGRVAYEGRRNVPLMGKREFKLPATAVAEMLRKAREARFEQFAKNYSSGADDDPSTIVAIRQPNGSFKQVAVEANAPENVKSYFSYLTTQFDQLGQVNGLAK